MKILHLSDTHSKHRELKNLPAADVIVHSGDVSWAGTENEVMDFMKWFFGLRYVHRIFVAGNHDDCLDGATVEGIPSKGCHYLCNSGVEIEGVRFWGVPLFVSDDIEGRFPQMMAQIPRNTDVLVTHRPPLGILDQGFGCPDMLQAVMEIRPRRPFRAYPRGLWCGEVGAYNICKCLADEREL